MSKFLKTSLITLSTLALILLGLFFIPSSSIAVQGGTILAGYAWSENIGWIDFAPVSGGVSSDSNGFLTGYVWSENIGWIKFGGLFSFPIGIDTVAQDAQILPNNKLIGWARACAGTIDGDCSTMDSSTNGWDGWISLSGSTSDSHDYNVSVSNNNFSGYAWGGDTVVGWIDFAPPFGGVTIATPITIDLYANPPSPILKDTATIISWSSTGADFCIVTKDGDQFAIALSGSESSGNLSTTTTFLVQCNNSGSLASESLTVDVTDSQLPLINLVPEPSDILWEVLYAYTDGCTLQQGTSTPMSVATSGDYYDEDLQAGINFILECTGPGGTASSSVLSVEPEPKSICIPSQGTSTNMYVNRKTTWTMTNATGTVSNVTWTGTNIPSSPPTTTLGNILYKIYTTVGQKNINGAGTVTRSSDGKTFSSTCFTSTSVKLDTGQSGEI